MGERPSRYRYRTAALTGRWRDSRAAAEEDAVRAKQAVAEGESEGDGGLRWLVPGEIEAQENDAARAAVGRR
jgi:hypothetical protein